MSTAIVFGANGISGLALIAELTSRPATEWKKIIALSRREPVFDHKDDRIVFKSVDLLGSKEDVVSALKQAGAAEADHVFFYAYIAKADEGELIEINRALFANALDAVAAAVPHLKTFQLQTGLKYYGCHLGGTYLAPYPWKEDAPRHAGRNFYFVQEDMLAKAGTEHGWKQIVTRPNFIIGASKGNFMSLATTIALYATAKKGIGEPLTFPGTKASWDNPYNHSIASHNARAQVYLAEKGVEGAFNVHAGHNEVWGSLWERIAEYFEMPYDVPTEPQVALASPPAEILSPNSAAEWWSRTKHRVSDISQQTGIDAKSFEYATWEFLDFTTSRTWKDVATKDKLTVTGFKDDVDVWDGWKGVLDGLRQMSIVPGR